MIRKTKWSEKTHPMAGDYSGMEINSNYDLLSLCIAYMFMNSWDPFYYYSTFR